MKIGRFLSRSICVRKPRILQKNCVNFNVRHMSILPEYRFTVVLPDKTFNLVHDERATRSSISNGKDENGGFLFGFKHLGNSNEEDDLKSAIAVYNVSRDVNALNGEKIDLHIASVFLSESESRIHRGVAVSSEIGDVQNISQLREIFHKYGINTVFQVTPISTNVEGTNNECMRVSPLNSENWTALLDKGGNFRRDSTQQSSSVVIENKKFCPVFQDLARARYIIEKVILEKCIELSTPLKNDITCTSCKLNMQGSFENVNYYCQTCQT